MPTQGDRPVQSPRALGQQHQREPRPSSPHLSLIQSPTGLQGASQGSNILGSPPVLSSPCLGSNRGVQSLPNLCFQKHQVKIQSIQLYKGLFREIS